MSDELSLLTVTGFLLILLGVAFILIPIILKYLPSLEDLPPIIIYIYRKDSFFFATSPILIILGAVYLIWRVVMSLKY